jgi:hypothetical protein
VNNDANISVGTITDSNNNEIKIDNIANFSIQNGQNITTNEHKEEKHTVNYLTFGLEQFAVGVISEGVGGGMGNFASSFVKAPLLSFATSFAVKFPIKSGLDLGLNEVFGTSDDGFGMNINKHSSDDISKSVTEVESSFNYRNLTVK